MENIILEPHQDVWAAKYSAEKDLLRTAFSALTKIHHVGSTAVPDLLSKPIIDIGVECEEFPPGPEIINRLKALGYALRGECGVAGRIWFTKGSPREINLHFCAVDSVVIRRQLAFRDALLKDEQLRRKYEQIKLEHYSDRPIDDPDYAGAKTALIDEVTGSRTTP